MWQVVMVIAAFGIMVVAVKVILIFLILVGLIFRTSQTLTLLAIGGILTAFQVHPWIVSGIVSAVLAVGFYLKRKEDAAINGELKSLPSPEM